MGNTVFSNLKVLELASVLAGPSVGQFFAELGAQVIKIENPKTNGDVTRSWRVQGENQDDISAYFACTNWGKQSLTLDISTQKGLNILYELVKWADIVISSYKPGDDKKLKVDYQVLKDLNPRVIYGHITGYGGEDNKVGYDAIIQAESGLMSINGEVGSAPLKMPVAFMDLMAGHQLKEALLVSYINLLQTGQGGYVEVSLIDAAIASLANQATNFLMIGSEPQKHGSAHPNIAPYGDIYQTSDGKQLILAVGNNVQFQSLLSILKLKGDDKFETNTLRVENRIELTKLLKEHIIMWNADNLLKTLNDHKIPAGIVNSVSEALGNHGQRLKLSHGEKIKGLRVFAATGIDVSKSTHFLPPPHLGEHNRQILSTILQLSKSEIEELAGNGII